MECTSQTWKSKRSQHAEIKANGVGGFKENHIRLPTEDIEPTNKAKSCFEENCNRVYRLMKILWKMKFPLHLNRHFSPFKFVYKNVGLIF